MVDRASARMPYLYWSARTGMLEIAIVSVFIWFATGFNVVEGGVPVIGIQWSTFETFSLFFYLFLVNYQVGGLKTASQLFLEIKRDFRAIKLSFRHPYSSREVYLNEAAFDGLRGSAMAFLFCVSALFLFECIWVPLYDYFQFGSITWPVYFAQRTSSIWLTPVFDRNVLDFILPLVFGLMIPSLAMDGKGNILTQRFSFHPRLDFWWWVIIWTACIMWGAWLIWPHSTVDISALTQSQVLGPMGNSFSQSNCYIYPTQNLFPQNTYTFYPCSIYLKSYQLPQILGFFNPDPWLHLVNVLTKYITFLAVCYPLMGRISVNEAQ